ncbi:MAG: hypothetical protein ACOYMU_10840 [Phycisphaerales bacterium]
MTSGPLVNPQTHPSGARILGRVLLWCVLLLYVLPFLVGFLWNLVVWPVGRALGWWS